MNCMKCKSENIIISEECYCIVTYNPTVPYVDNAIKYTCSDCNYTCFGVD